MTREEWLNKAVDELRPLFKEAGASLPKQIHVSVGFPGGRGPKRHVIGQCWAPEAVSDSKPSIFISPVHKKPVDILVTLTHELVHAQGRKGHRKEFSDLAAKVGLIKPWTSTPAGEDLIKRLKVIAKRLGAFKHGTINPTFIKRQTTRLLKVACPDDGYTIRVTQKWLDRMGFTVCPCGTEMERA